MVDAVLLKPLPFPHADRLVSVMEASPAKNQKESLIAPARLADWGRRNRTFEGIAGSYSDSLTDTSGSEPERLSARRVSPGYFTVFGAAPLFGRTFTPQEDLYGGPQAAILSQKFWASRFHSDPTVIGRRLILGGKPFFIVGVMPGNFTSSKVDIWIPAQLAPSLMRYREARFYSGVGRIKPGVTIQQAREDLGRVQAELGRQFPQTDRGWSALVTDLQESRVAGARDPLLFVFAAVTLLLLIAVINIAGLTLSQLQRREKEFAIRGSLGATRLQVAGAVLREMLLLSALAVFAGSLLADWLLRAMGASFAALPLAGGIRLDWRALCFAAAAGVLATVSCGLLPAFQATRGNTAALLAQAGRGSSGARYKWQSALIAGQIAFTTLLLIAAALMLRSYYDLAHVDLGFDPVHAISFHAGASWDEDRTRIGEMQEDLIAKLERVPGVEAAGFTNFLPAMGATLRFPVVLDQATSGGETSAINAGERSITKDYLKAIGAPLLAGQSCPDLRALTSQAPKALVSRRFAALYGNGRNLIGRHFRFAEFPAGNPPFEIVGVVGEIREDTLNVTPAPYVYSCIGPGGWPDPEYVVRTRGDPRSLVSSIGGIVHGIDPSRAVFGVQTLDDFLASELQQPRLTTRMIAVFALTAMLLAAIGLYSLLTLIVSSRRREIGVRLTLGAAPADIVRQVVFGVLRLLAIGFACGLALTLTTQKLLRAVLFGVAPTDAATLTSAVLFVAAVSLLATFGPVRRAARIDPMAAMRED